MKHMEKYENKFISTNEIFINFLIRYCKDFRDGFKRVSLSGYRTWHSTTIWQEYCVGTKGKPIWMIGCSIIVGVSIHLKSLEFIYPRFMNSPIKPVVCCLFHNTCLYLGALYNFTHTKDVIGQR